MNARKQPAAATRDEPAVAETVTAAEPPEHDVIFVDLIKDEPLAREEWRKDPEAIAASDCVYQTYLDRFQPWRWHSSSEGNHEILGHGERYFNEADAERNIRLNFSGNSIVYLRRAEHGNENLRWAYPLDQGEVIVLGPECFVKSDGSVLNWRGINYIPAPEAQA